MNLHGWMLGLLVLTAPVAANAQSTPAVIPAPVDPARLSVARALVDTIMPPATRSQMLDGMVRPMLANIQRSIAQDPNFTKLFDQDSRARGLFETFMQRQTDRSLATMQPLMPGMWEAMARAYARRFSIAQMGEIRAFFETPTGRLYMQQSLTMMGDPDIAAWQADAMRQSMHHVQDDVADLVRQMEALERDRKGSPR